MKTAIYTAIYGGRDRLREIPLGIFEASVKAKVSWLCFTDDRDLNSRTWTVLHREFPPQFDPVLSARYIKMSIFSHFAGFSRSVWVDARSDIKSNLWEMFGGIKGSFSVASHYSRDCAYDEIEACLAQNKDLPDRLDLARRALERDGHPRKFGLWMTGLMFQRNTRKCRELMSFWAEDTCRHTRRDQVTLPNLVRKLQFPVHTLTQEQLNSCVSFGGHAK